MDSFLKPIIKHQWPIFGFFYRDKKIPCITIAKRKKKMMTSRRKQKNLNGAFFVLFLALKMLFQGGRVERNAQKLDGFRF